MSSSSLFAALDWTPEFYFGLPLADEETGGCPHCGGLHYASAKRIYRDRPSVYKCLGTEYPNAQNAPYKTPCGKLFRGRRGRHFAPEFFADFLALDPAAA